MQELIICIGISGSGKSTWATNYIKENSNTLRINRDDIRKTLVGNLNGYYKKDNLNYIERDVTRLEEEFYKHLNLSRFNIIIDNTNLKESYINRWISLSSSNKMDSEIKLKFKLFNISLDDAQRRVANREKMQTFEDLDYINKQFEQYKQIKYFIEKNYEKYILH